MQPPYSIHLLKGTILRLILSKIHSSRSPRAAIEVLVSERMAWAVHLRLRSKVWDLGFRVEGSGFRVRAFSKE